MNLLKFCKDLYPIQRSITGKGLRQTLEYIQEYIPIKIKEVKSGTKIFDWIVPPEWNINKAYVQNLDTGEKIIDFKNHNLHIVSYSIPINQIVSYNELKKHLHYLEDQPNAIPYVTSYYSNNWGFCLSYEDFKLIDNKVNYKVVIDSEFDNAGSLNYAELIVKGKVKQELFFSSYVCHPQMVNNELSGPAVLTGIAKKILESDNYFSYRFVFVPETIGSIVYINKNLKTLKNNVIGGFNISCVGDERMWGYIPSRYGKTITDEIAKNVLLNNCNKFREYTWLDRGSDERQYCSPGVDLPICSITRSKFGDYPEYHTSEDDFNLVTNKGLNESLKVYLECINIFEKGISIFPKVNVLCEPQLGKRGLQPNMKTKKTKSNYRSFKNFISYCDGTNSIFEISKLCKINFNEAYSFYLILKKNKLLYHL